MTSAIHAMKSFRICSLDTAIASHANSFGFLLTAIQFIAYSFCMRCKTLLEKAKASQKALAEALGLSDANVSRVLNGLIPLTQDFIDGTLAFLSKKLGRSVTYEEAFGKPRKRRA